MMKKLFFLLSLFITLHAHGMHHVLRRLVTSRPGIQCTPRVQLRRNYSYNLENENPLFRYFPAQDPETPLSVIAQRFMTNDINDDYQPLSKGYSESCAHFAHIQRLEEEAKETLSRIGWEEFCKHPVWKKYLDSIQTKRYAELVLSDAQPCIETALQGTPEKIGEKTLGEFTLLTEPFVKEYRLSHYMKNCFELIIKHFFDEHIAPHLPVDRMKNCLPDERFYIFKSLLAHDAGYNIYREHTYAMWRSLILHEMEDRRGRGSHEMENIRGRGSLSQNLVAYALFPIITMANLSLILNM